MTSDSTLADRVRAVFARLGIVAVEKRMMGGLCFMVDDKMCLGVNHDRLMVRLDPDKYDWAIEQSGCRPMDFTGRPMRGFVWVDGDGHDLQSQLEQWIDLALEYNPREIVKETSSTFRQGQIVKTEEMKVSLCKRPRKLFADVRFTLSDE